MLYFGVLLEERGEGLYIFSILMNFLNPDFQDYYKFYRLCAVIENINHIK